MDRILKVSLGGRKESGPHSSGTSEDALEGRDGKSSPRGSRTLDLGEQNRDTGQRTVGTTGHCHRRVKSGVS